MQTAAAASVRVAEIFHSLQGESTRVGLPTVFVRLSGCPLRCRWCDSAYAFSGGEVLDIAAIIDRVRAFACPTVCVTGGEPLAQKGSLALLAALCDEGFSVSLETSGALDIGGVDARVSRVMDLKAPDSGEAARNRWQNLDLLTCRDEVKIVIASETDYLWAKQVLDEKRPQVRCTVLLSPAAGVLDARQLAEWILRDRLPVRFQWQLHKLLWGDERGR